jgi:peptide/nickel transport system permease protein
MLWYIVRRLLLAVPTLLAVSFFAFGLGKCSGGDPVTQVFGEEPLPISDIEQQAAAYRSKAAMLGLHRPTFYFSANSAAYPDSLWDIFPLERRSRLEKLIGQTGNWEAVRAWESAAAEMAKHSAHWPASVPQTVFARREALFLLGAERLEAIPPGIDSLKKWASAMPMPEGFGQKLDNLEKAAQTLLHERTPHKFYIPKLAWNGFDNQYHRWLSGFVSGDLGLTRRRTEVGEELRASMLTSMAINGLAIFLAYLVAIPLGVEFSRRKGRWLDRWGQRLLVFVYSMPVFWLGGLFVMVVTQNEWARSVLPSIYFDINDAWKPGQDSFARWWADNAAKCVLPIAILSLHALAMLALQMRSGMLSALKEDYVRTARAKGVPEEDVYWHHALRNALFPIITIFANVLPAVFTGSLVVETLFAFPGIGTKTLEAYLQQDMPMISAVMMVAAALTVLGALLADLLYAWADPRVRFAR